MDTKNIRLLHYLAKVEAQFRWDYDPNRKPVIFFAKDESRSRPDTEIDETRAFALGHLSDFEVAAIEKRRELLNMQVLAVREISPKAAAAYRAELNYWRGMDEHHLGLEKENRDARVMRRWGTKEAERKEQRAERVKERLLGYELPPVIGDQRRPQTAKSGFHEHAKRETALEQARQYVAAQRQSRDQERDQGHGPDIG